LTTDPKMTNLPFQAKYCAPQFHFLPHPLSSRGKAE
jgi:hypothetical protein